MFCKKLLTSTCTQVAKLRSIPQVRLLATEINESPKIEKSLNQVTLLGRVGNAPKRRGSDEKPVVIFSVATHTNYKNESVEEGEFLQRTDWHKVCVFKPYLRELVESYLAKGQRVFVTGRLSYGEYKDDLGATRMATSVIAEDVIFLQSSGSSKE